MASISLLKIAEKMKLENLTPEINLKGIKVTLPDINRPALPMAGYFEHFEATRLQVIGFVEYSYVKRMSEREGDAGEAFGLPDSRHYFLS